MTLEHRIGRLLTAATLVGVVALGLGVVAMLAGGIDPTGTPPVFHPGAVPGDILGARPVGLLWLGLLIVIATPPLRVAAALVGYAARAEWRMVSVSAAILAVIAVGIVVGLRGG